MLLVLPAVKVTIIPIIQIKAVFVKFKIALAKAFMYLVMLKPIKLKKAIAKTVKNTIDANNGFYPIYLKYCYGRYINALPFDAIAHDFTSNEQGINVKAAIAAPEIIIPNTPYIPTINNGET